MSQEKPKQQSDQSVPLHLYPSPIAAGSTAELNTGKFDFIDKTIYEKHLTCKVCRNIFHKPTRLHPCAHTFCEQCSIHEYVRLCPVCDLEVQAKQVDILASKLIGNMKVKCKNEGCPWKGTFDQFKQFHSDNCKLKNGGISAWLKSMNQTVKNVQSAFKRGLDSDDEEVLDRKNQFQKVSEPRTARITNQGTPVFFSKSNQKAKQLKQAKKGPIVSDVTCRLLEKYSRKDEAGVQESSRKIKSEDFPVENEASVNKILHQFASCQHRQQNFKICVKMESRNQVEHDRKEVNAKKF